MTESVRFRIEARRKAAFSVLFPDPITKERHVWGQTTCHTDGVWTKYRLTIGDLQGVINRAKAIAEEFSAQRSKMPNIDQIRLYEEISQARPTGLDYWDYTGRVDTVSRESVFAMYRSGQKVALKRDEGYGFRGIITRAEEPWTMEQFAWDTMMKIRLHHLNFGDPFDRRGITTREPWVLRDAAEQDLRKLLDLAWSEYTNEQTLENLDKVIGVESVLRDYLVQTMRWVQLLDNWEHMERIPFPDLSTAIRLWEQNLMDNLIYDETAPWQMDMPPQQTVPVRMVRGAYLSNGKVTINIRTHPKLNTLEHPKVDAAHHLLSYDKPPYVGVSVPNPNATQRWSEPFIGWKGTDPWQGFIPTAPDWRYIKADNESIPEPTLNVRTMPKSVSKHVSESLEAALAGDRPTLMFVNINRASAPVLVLPRMYFNTWIVPLFGGGISLEAKEEHNRIEGWVTDGIGKKPMERIFDRSPFGFLPSQSSNRPIREGAIQEVLPYS